MTLTATIASGQTTSDALACNGPLVGLTFPAAFTGTSVALHGSADGATYVPLYDSAGTAVTVAAAANRGVYLDPVLTAGSPFVKLVSNAPEGADRAIAATTTVLRSFGRIPFAASATAPTTTSLGYALRVGFVWLDTSGGIGVLRRCTAVASGTGTWELIGAAVVKLPLGHADTAGGVLAWQNPEGAAIILTGITLYEAVSTADPAFGNEAGAGIVPDATTASAALGFATTDNGGDPQVTTMSGAVGILAAGQYLTISKNAGSMAGLAGYAYLAYHLA